MPISQPAIYFDAVVLWEAFLPYTKDKETLVSFQENHLKYQIELATGAAQVSNLDSKQLDDLTALSLNSSRPVLPSVFPEVETKVVTQIETVIETVVAPLKYTEEHFLEVDRRVYDDKIRQTAALDEICLKYGFNRESFEKQYRNRHLNVKKKGAPPQIPQ
jgi:hypothetical protein